MTIKQKRDGKIKGRHCADGRKQRGTMRKIDVTSPTVANDSVFLTAAIAAFEGRKVGTTDIPCAFPQVTLPDEDDEVLMTLRGPLAELMALSAPEVYRDYVTLQNGRKILYVRLKSALYGMLRSALLFYRKLWGNLVDKGFK